MTSPSSRSSRRCRSARRFEPAAVARVAPAGLALTFGGLALLAAGCTLDPPVRPRPEHDIALYAYLFVGEPISEANAFLLTRVQPVNSSASAEQAAISDALVLLRQEGRDQPDTLRLVGPGRYANPSVVIEERTTYSLTIAVPGADTITARTTTPRRLTVVTPPPTVPASMRYAAIPDSFPIGIFCAGDEQILMVDAYCREDWSDARYVHSFNGQDRPKDFTEYGGVNGPPRHLSAYCRYGGLPGTDSARSIGWYGSLLAFFGEYDLAVLSIDSNIYSSLVGERPEEASGVVGAIGILGSVSRSAFRIRVTPPAPTNLKPSEAAGVAEQP